MPIKTQTLGGNVLYPHEHREYRNGVQVYFGNSSNFYNRNWRYRQWTTTANWKSVLAARGYLDTLAYSDNSEYFQPSGAASAVRLVDRSDPGHIWIFKPTPSSPVQQAMTSPQLASRSVVDQLSDTQFKALAKARDMKVNLAVAFGEGRKTVDSVTGTARTLGKAYSAFRKGRFGRAARILGIDRPPKTLANNWLAYQYGWLPLISDVKGAAESLAAYLEVPRAVRLTVRSKVEQSYSFKTLVSGPVTNAQQMHRGRDKITTRAGLYLEITSKGDQFLASLGIGGIADVALLGWELVPFSFVFDWFLKVGQYLEGISALSGITVLDGWTIVERQRNSVVVGFSNAYWSSDYPEVPIRQRQFSRSRWTGGTPTWPVFRALRGIDATKLTTTAALYQQLFRNDPPIGKFRPRWS